VGWYLSAFPGCTAGSVSPITTLQADGIRSFVRDCVCKPTEHSQAMPSPSSPPLVVSRDSQVHESFPGRLLQD